VYPWFGLLSKLITDRDPRFTSHFGQALAKELGITWNLSMAFHPQTNGLAEHANQKVEQLLQLSGTNQNEWADMLPLLTLVHNNNKNSMTGHSLNQLLIGGNPEIMPTVAIGSDNPLAESQVE
jgi:hypothetical protein